MNIPDGYHPLDGSERRPSPTATKVGPADPNEMLTVSINLRRRPDHEIAPLLLAILEEVLRPAELLRRLVPNRL